MTSKKIIIAAVAQNQVIGIDGRIPWRIPNDMKRFKDLTTGNAVIMGRKTYDSIPKKFKPLPDRTNIVLTADSSRDYKINLEENGVFVATSIDDALRMAERSHEQVFFAGGSRVYEEALHIADTMELTIVHGNYNGDAYFPIVDWERWNIINQERIRDEARELDYSFLTCERI